MQMIMQAKNNEKHININVNERLMTCRFFNELKLFFTTVNNIHAERKFDELPLEFEVLRYFEEFIVMNRPLEDLHNAIQPLDFQQAVRLIEAADYFWDDTVYRLALNHLSELTSGANYERFVQYSRLVDNSHMKRFIEHDFYVGAQTCLDLMDFHELGTIYQTIVQEHREQLFGRWRMCAWKESLRSAVAAIESEIDRFVELHQHMPFAGVDWRWLQPHPREMNFTDAFVKKYKFYRDDQERFHSETLPHIIDLTYRKMPLLSLSSLPFVSMRFKLLMDTVPDEYWTSHRPYQMPNYQWNGTTIHHNNYANWTPFNHSHIRGDTLTRVCMRRDAMMDGFNQNETMRILRYEDPASFFYDPCHYKRSYEHQERRDSMRQYYFEMYDRRIEIFTDEIDALLDEQPRQSEVSDLMRRLIRAQDNIGEIEEVVEIEEELRIEEVVEEHNDYPAYDHVHELESEQDVFDVGPSDELRLEISQIIERADREEAQIAEAIRRTRDEMHAVAAVEPDELVGAALYQFTRANLRRTGRNL
jgi:hypothetical protein